jgi:methylglutaconyl-CoA hydratase
MAALRPFLRRCFTSAAPTELRLTYLTGSDAGTAVLTLSRGASRNALGRTLLGELEHALAAASATARALVVCSDVPGVFCAGADLKERSGMSQREASAFVARLGAAFSALAGLPLPTIAALEGVAVGGGLELALACDFRVASEAAVLGLPETGLAIIPGAGGTQRLPRLIGPARAKELIFTGRRVGGAEALALGLACRAVPPGQALAAATELARATLAGGPIAQRLAKAAVDGGLGLDLASGLALEAACYAQVIPTADRLEGLAAFREKRKPVYRGE